MPDPQSAADAATAYLDEAAAMIERIRDDQLAGILTAAEWCADAIAADGLVHLFGTGHSRVLTEEFYPRYGSFPGFHPIVELSMTFFTNVVGSNGMAQTMFIERTEGLAEVILGNFEFGDDDIMIVFSSTGVNAVTIEIALGAKARGMRVIGVSSLSHSRQATSGHSSGKRLFEVVDLALDNASLPGDALVAIEGTDTPVAPGSTVGGAVVVNAIKAATARLLADRGVPLYPFTSPLLVGEERSRELFEASWQEHKRLVRRL